jgi:hypothetical protein
MLVGFGLLFALALRRLPAPPLLGLLAPLLVLAAEIAAQRSFRAYDLSEVAREAKRDESAGIAFLGSYLGEITFLARLDRPVTTMRDMADAPAWGAAHPGGILIVRSRDGSGPPGWTAVHHQAYRGGAIELWQAPPEAAPSP